MPYRNTPTFKSFEEKVETLKVRWCTWHFSQATVNNCIVMTDVTTDQGGPDCIIHWAGRRIRFHAECRAGGRTARQDDRSGPRATLRNSLFTSLHPSLLSLLLPSASPLLTSYLAEKQNCCSVLTFCPSKLLGKIVFIGSLSRLDSEHKKSRKFFTFSKKALTFGTTWVHVPLSSVNRHHFIFQMFAWVWYPEHAVGRHWSWSRVRWRWMKTWGFIWLLTFVCYLLGSLPPNHPNPNAYTHKQGQCAPHGLGDTGLRSTLVAQPCTFLCSFTVKDKHEAED